MEDPIKVVLLPCKGFKIRFLLLAKGFDPRRPSHLFISEIRGMESEAIKSINVAYYQPVFNDFIIEITTENARHFEGAARPGLCYL